MCLTATVMSVANRMLLRWALDSVVLPIVIKPKVVTEALQCKVRAQVQSYVSQTELTSKLNLQRNYVALVERHFRSKNN